MNNNFFIAFFRLLMIIFILVISFYFLKIMFFYLYPFWIAYVLALLFNPTVTYIETNFKFSRLWATLMTILSFFILFIFIFIFISFFIFEETLLILEKLPSYIDHLLSFIEIVINNTISYFNDNILSIFYTLPMSQQTLIKEYVSNILTYLSDGISQILNIFIINLTMIITSLSYSITVSLIIGISLFFILKDWQQINAYFKKMVPSSFLLPIKQFTYYFKKAMVGFIKGQIIIASISAMIIFLSLVIFKIEHALTLALLSFFGDFIPYAGLGVIFIPWIIYCFLMSHYLLTIKLALLYIVLIIVRQFIEPKILASSIGISPLITLIVLFVSFSKWGFLGIVLSPLLLITISSAHHSGLLDNIWYFIKK